MHYVENQVSLEENMADLCSGFEQNQEGDRMEATWEQHDCGFGALS